MSGSNFVHTGPLEVVHEEERRTRRGHPTNSISVRSGQSKTVLSVTGYGERSSGGFVTTLRTGKPRRHLKARSGHAKASAETLVQTEVEVINIERELRHANNLLAGDSRAFVPNTSEACSFVSSMFYYQGTKSICAHR